MFYSQFILAKKGPLGTIWIAAHLERKLRKNQVADTDIGVSVDSILFPDVPIALRLSSHLLVGVVRIYSRKVNYLFDDCSEALLKIKQAFRSTAVDLPPEESTAPYHSITLPETFDLDDFELPDNEMFQGNYVDHHISTKEQITLQDTMDGVVYSTSQFGLDERFGEGDASQIGLDIDGDLFMGKVTTEENDGVPGLSPLASAQPMTPGEKDGIYEGIPGTSEMMQDNGGDYQTENPTESREATEHLRPPFTPGFECFTPFNDHETDQVEAKDHDLQESEAADHGANGNSKSDAQKMVSQPEEIGYFPSDTEKMKKSDSIEHSAAVAVATENTSADQGVPSPSSDMVEQLRNIPQPPECSNGDIAAENGPIRVEEGHNGDVINNEQSTHLVDRTDMQGAESPTVSQVTTELEDPGRRNYSIDGEIHNNMGESCSTSNVLTSNVCPQESPDRPEVVNAEAQTFLEPKETEILTNSTHELNNKFSGLRACNSFRQPDMPLPGGEGNLTNSTHELNKEFSGLSACTSFRQPDMSSPGGKGLESGPMLHTETPDESRKLNEETNNAASGANHLTGAGTGSAASDLPAPEKMLSVTEGLKSNDLLLLSTPEKELHGNSTEAVDTELISGKKRSFTESTLTVHSLNSGDSFSMNKSRRTAESIPGDDDLLSSILVGRKSSVLKLKPTPPASEIISRKRHRSAPRPSALKRKVLLDDMMVLHGDTIRQQLTNTEDIRRLRKKAPCTRPEIAMIQRHFLEEEIFREPIFTGMSEELVSLHREAFDLISIKVSEVGTEITPIELGKDVESSVVRHDEETQPGDLCIEKQNLHVENSELRSQEETPAEIAEMEIDGQDLPFLDILGPSVHDLVQLLPSNPVVDDCAHIPENVLETGAVDGNIDIDASIQMDRPCMSPQAFDTIPVEDSLVADTSKVEVDTTEVNENEAEVRVDFEKDESKFNVSLEMASENMTNINENQSTEVIEDIDHRIVNPDVDTIDLGCDEKVVTSSALGEGTNKDSGFSVEPDVNGEIDPIDKEVNIELQDQADLGSAMNADIAAETSAIEFRGDFDDVMAGHDAVAVHDTEFLNVDDDDVDEDNEDYTEGAEETRVLENSGWSSRTRAVSKYLQILFEKEPVQGKRVLAMDNLLTGKTRKEASRMFFETLVLKTKDYVHVEQANPFDNINVKPRIKLMKSDF